MKEIWIIADDSGIVMWFGHFFLVGQQHHHLLQEELEGDSKVGPYIWQT